ncbi:MAG: transcription elongation factor NusA [Nitrososphaeria archaeon]
MKFPICTFDAKVGVLCPRCEERLRNGEITDADVKASFALAKLAVQVPALDKLTLKRAYLIDGDYILLFNQGEARALLSNRSLMGKLKEAIGNFWVTEQTSDMRQFIEDLLYPVRILTVNVVWIPDGTRQIKAVISGSRSANFPVDLAKAAKIVKAIKGDDVVFEFERGKFERGRPRSAIQGLKGS